jgi:hypothetical protein
MQSNQYLLFEDLIESRGPWDKADLKHSEASDATKVRAYFEDVICLRKVDISNITLMAHYSTKWLKVSESFPHVLHIELARLAVLLSIKSFLMCMLHWFKGPL